MRSNIPNVNASLIREVRMIVQQFFRHKESATFWESKPPRPQVAVLKCSFCVDIRKRPLDADTVINGYAVCPKHARYVRGDEYDRILALIRKNEEK